MAFPDTGYIEQVIQRETVGESGDAGVRAGAVVLRTQDTRQTHTHSGVLTRHGFGLPVVTSHHLYYGGPTRSFRVLLKSINLVETPSNGMDAVRITREDAHGLSQFFVVGTGRVDFVREIIWAVASLDADGIFHIFDPATYHLREVQ